jgi:hypothetical protein
MKQVSMVTILVGGVAVLIGALFMVGGEPANRGDVAAPRAPVERICAGLMKRLIAAELGAKRSAVRHHRVTLFDAVSPYHAHAAGSYDTVLGPVGRYQARVAYRPATDRCHMTCFALVVEIAEGRPSCF